MSFVVLPGVFGAPSPLSLPCLTHVVASKAERSELYPKDATHQISCEEFDPAIHGHQNRLLRIRKFLRASKLSPHVAYGSTSDGQYLLIVFTEDPVWPATHFATIVYSNFLQHRPMLWLGINPIYSYMIVR